MARQYLVVNFDPVQADTLAAFAAHMQSCAYCSHYRMASPRRPTCVRGLLYAGKAADLIRSLGILDHVDADQSREVPK